MRKQPLDGTAHCQFSVAKIT